MPYICIGGDYCGDWIDKDYGSFSLPRLTDFEGHRYYLTRMCYRGWQFSVYLHPGQSEWNPDDVIALLREKLPNRRNATVWRKPDGKIGPRTSKPFS